jgi:hypothetical protein
MSQPWLAFKKPAFISSDSDKSFGLTVTPAEIRTKYLRNAKQEYYPVHLDFVCGMINVKNVFTLQCVLSMR